MPRTLAVRRFARPSACLLACLSACLQAWLLASPAAAAEPPAPPPPVKDEPVLGVVLLPVPLVAIAAGLTYDNFAIGPTRHEARLVGGYYWSRNYYYDPLGTMPLELQTPEGRYITANTWQLRGAWGWRLRPGATLYLDGLGIAGGPAATGGYDDPLTGGASVSAGPLLQLSSLDAMGYPTRGSLLRAGWAPGYHWGPAAFQFQRATLDLMHFVPLSARSTVALRAVAQLASPQLAWIDKFSAGGGSFLRGFQWNRFTGDELIAGTVEYRRLLEPDLLGRLGLWERLGVAALPLKVGVASTTYFDLGRAWEGRRGLGVPFPFDVRIGGGTGVLALVNGAPAGRVELNVSPEGIFPVASGGASF